MLGAASVLVVHARLWFFVGGGFHTLDDWREGEQRAAAPKTQSEQNNLTALDGPPDKNKTKTKV